MQPVMDAHSELAALALLSCVCRDTRVAVTRVWTPEKQDFGKRRFRLFVNGIVSALMRSGPTARMSVLPGLTSMCAALASGPPADGNVSHGAALARAALEQQRQIDDTAGKRLADVEARSLPENRLDETLKFLGMVEMFLGDHVRFEVLGAYDTGDESHSTQEEDDDAGGEEEDEDDWEEGEGDSDEDNEA